MQTPPVSCLLDADAYRDRMAWIAGLTQRALRSSLRDGLMLRLFYAPASEADVRTMVERERSCCPLLTFDIVTDANDVTLTITAPDSARASVDALFSQFLAVPTD